MNLRHYLRELMTRGRLIALAIVILLAGLFSPVHAGGTSVVPAGPSTVTTEATSPAIPAVSVFLAAYRPQGPPIICVLVRGQRAFFFVVVRGHPLSAWDSLYAYCGGDPVNRTDMTGLEWELSFEKNEGETPVFTINSGGKTIYGRWIPEPGMPNAPNPQGWQEEFQAAAADVDTVLLANPGKNLHVAANHPVQGFNGFDFGADDAYSAWDQLARWGSGKANYRAIHNKDREGYALLAAIQADPTQVRRLMNGALTVMVGAEVAGAGAGFLAPATGAGLLAIGGNVAGHARTSWMAARLLLAGNVTGAAYVAAPAATASLVLGGEVALASAGAPSLAAPLAAPARNAVAFTDDAGLALSRWWRGSGRLVGGGSGIKPPLMLDEPFLYRGVPASTDRFMDALNGIARPRGTDLSSSALIRHVLGEDVASGVTSWTTSLEVAQRFSGSGGLILRVDRGKVLGLQVLRPNVGKYASEEEVLLRGLINGAEKLLGR